MDERTFKAWEDIAERHNDPSAPQTINMTRSTLKELMDEIKSLREDLETEFEIGGRLVEELARWGWGDMHYGTRTQEARVSTLVNEYRALHPKDGNDV